MKSLTRDDVVKWLKKNFDKVFQKELEVWSMDERSWPRNRTYQMFTEWLDIKFYLELYDFESFPVEKEEE